MGCTVTVPSAIEYAPVFTSPAATSGTQKFNANGDLADNSLFQITVDNELEVMVAPDFEDPLDANSDNVYEVELKADDSNGLTTTQSR